MSERALPDFPRVYVAYRSKVLAYAAKLLGRQEAEDVAQDVFVKIGRALGSLQATSKLTPWIYAITLNTVRDHVRRRSRRPDGPWDDGDMALAQVADGRARSPEETAIRNEMIACYLDYVRRLPRRYYEVYALSELEALPAAKIARRLSLSLGTVKIRLHRARARLHEQLRRDCQCYYNERGELMGEPRPRSRPPARARADRETVDRKSESRSKKRQGRFAQRPA